jgi:hypothetical protein
MNNTKKNDDPNKNDLEYSDSDGDSDGDGDGDNDGECGNKYKVKCRNTNKECIFQPRCCQIDIITKLPTGILCIGRSGSGKTMAIVELLTNKNLLADCFDFTYLYTGITPDPELIADLNLPPENIKINFSEDEVAALIKKLEKTVAKNTMKNTPSVLMIFDDILMKDKFLKSKTMVSLVTTNRHCNLSYIILSQYFRKLPSVVRTNASYLMVFPSSLIELEKLSEEQCPPQMSKKEFIKIAQHATMDKYSFLSINTKVEAGKQLRKGFDKILSF